MSSIKILIAGEGGQGVQIITELLARVGHQSGKHVSYMPSFGVEQRGGASLAFLQINDKPITYPKFALADFTVAMSNRAVGVLEDRLSQETIFIFDSSNIDDEHLQAARSKITKFLAVPARDYANKNLSTKVTNMIFLGALLNYLPDFKVENIKNALKEKLEAKPELIELDIKAIDWGLNFAKSGQGQEFKGLAKKEIQKKFEDEKKSWERFPEYCKGCGLCITRCPVKALTFSNDLNFLGTQIPQVDLKKCTACGLCQTTCPDGAIKVTKKE